VSILNKPNHVLLSGRRDFAKGILLALMREGLPFPVKLFEDSFAHSSHHLLAKKNFPYLDKVNEAILHFHENGLLMDILWANDLKGYLSLL